MTKTSGASLSTSGSSDLRQFGGGSFVAAKRGLQAVPVAGAQLCSGTPNDSGSPSRDWQAAN